MKRLIAILIILCFINGCATVGKKVNQININQLEKGKTTKSEVIELFGQPNTTSFNQDDFLTFTYIGAQAKHTAWNFIPVVNLIHSKVDVKSQILTITFLDNVVQSYNFTNTDTPIKYGLIP